MVNSRELMRQNRCVSFDRRAVLRDSMSVALPVGTYGAAFGAASVAAGFSIAQTCALSLLLFSGASQFAVVGVMGAGGGAISAIATGALLGVRNGLYGMRMSPVLKLKSFKRFLGAQITIDESTGVALSQEERGQDAMKYGFIATGIGVYVFWNLFTLLGALGAQAIGNPSTWGLDAAVPAAFLGLVWPRLSTRNTKIAAGIAGLMAILLTPYVSAGVPIIATVLIALLLGWQS
jgi:predicted branched-subunit amino acid permease